jgi:transcriptional regulator with XRE-family HTH domain
VGYGHADKIAKSTAESAEQPADALAPPVAPEWYARPELAPALTGHDVGALFRALNEIGVSQRQIARLTGRSQPNISEIIHGRQVMSYEVLVAVSRGLGVPPERMGLSWWGRDGRWYGPAGTYPEGVTVAHTPEGVSADMLRRHLIALGGITMVGAPVSKMGQLLAELGGLPPVPLPSQLSPAHVQQVQDLTRRLAEVGNSSLCDPQVLSDATVRMSQWLDVPGPDLVQRALKVAVAELHIEAGWSAFDAGLYRRALYHYARALELATEAGDAYLQATALHYAGTASVEHGHPDDGLKMLQCGQVAAWRIPLDDERTVIVGQSGRAAVEAAGLATASTALVLLGDPVPAGTCLAKARELWTPTRTDPYGDLDRPAARLALARERLDLAEQLAAASMRRWEGGSLTSRTQSGVVLATIHVTAGEPRGLQLAHDAIANTTKLDSVRVRRQLTPLVEALEARPGSDARDLARMARQAAA